MARQRRPTKQQLQREIREFIETYHRLPDRQEFGYAPFGLSDFSAYRELAGTSRLRTIFSRLGFDRLEYVTPYVARCELTAFLRVYGRPPKPHEFDEEHGLRSSSFYASMLGLRSSRLSHIFVGLGFAKSGWRHEDLARMEDEST